MLCRILEGRASKIDYVNMALVVFLLLVAITLLEQGTAALFWWVWGAL